MYLSNDRTRLSDLQQLFLRAFPEPGEALLWAVTAGVDAHHLDPDLPSHELWRRIIEVASNERRLEALVREAVNDPIAAGYRRAFQRFLDGQASFARPARTKDDPVRDSGDTADPYHGAVVGGRFQLRERINTGEVSAVYRARDLEQGGRVAIKILLGRAAEDATVEARFEREARIIQSMDHPGLPRMLDYGATPDGLLYIAMELLRGATLRELTGGRRMEPSTAIRLVNAALDILQAVHDMDVVHRALRPENIFVGADERVRLLDLGLAKVVHATGQVLTRSGGVFGNLYYASPEQLIDSSLIDARSDIFGMGAVLFELLTTETPLARGEYGKDLMSLLDGRLRTRPSQVCPDLPADLDDALARALNPDPAQRYARALDMADALELCRKR
jgi:serine/threonine-protein kinase